MKRFFKRLQNWNLSLNKSWRLSLRTRSSREYNCIDQIFNHRFNKYEYWKVSLKKVLTRLYLNAVKKWSTRHERR